MIYIEVVYSDGNYSLREVSPDRKRAIPVGPEFMARWEAHCAEARFWHDILRAFDNGKPL